MASRHILRQKQGKGFIYLHDGRQLTGKEELARIKSLGIPPAWHDVKISASHEAKVQATGYDKAGRLQYIYHPRFRAAKDKAKFERILRFARALPKMRQTVNKHLTSEGLNREKVMATIVKLMDEAYFRVGGEESARENQHYGISTLRTKHVRVEGDTINFDFVGKSGQHQLQKLTDRRLANILRKLDELPGYEVFKYFDEEGNLKKVSSDDVNQYIKEVMGEEFSAKDFRTWGGTLIAAAELAQAERARNKNERKRIVTVCVAKVAAKLGNTPAIARASYIDPRVIASFVETNDLAKVKETVRDVGNSYLSGDERCVLKLLERTV